MLQGSSEAGFTRIRLNRLQVSGWKLVELSNEIPTGVVNGMVTVGSLWNGIKSIGRPIGLIPGTVFSVLILFTRFRYSTKACGELRFSQLFEAFGLPRWRSPLHLPQERH
jgi:hypothetical protein